MRVPAKFLTKQSRPSLNIPSIHDVKQKIEQLVELGLELTCNEDGQVSSPELTTWYIEVFLRSNNLKR